MSFGIEAIEIYFPKTFVDQQDLQTLTGASKGKYTQGLGQLQLAFAYPQEDVNSIALTVVHRLMKRNGIQASQVGRLEVGTESLVDKSKSTKTHLMRLFPQNHDIEGATSLNACYGATNALINTLNWIASPSWDGRYGIVVATDVAVYEEGPARPTGGAGAVALLISNRPKIAISPTRASYIDDQYDFYKPIPSSEYPVVDGKVSMDLYINAMKQCFKLYKQKTNQKSILDSNDYVCFHTPFYKMVQKAFQSLAKTENSSISSEESASLFLKKVEPTLFISKRIGNIYTGSLYACLVSLLYRTPDITNKNTLLFSYGSGLCSTLLQAHIISNPLSQSQISAIDEMFKGRVKISAEEFSKIMKYKEETYGKWRGKIQVDFGLLADNTYYLESIDEKWRRTYKLNQLHSESLVKTNINAIERIKNIDKMIPVEKVEEKSFHKMTISDRRELINRSMGHSVDLKLLEEGGISSEQGDKIIENVIGKLSLPLGVVPMLLINNKKYMVPMCTEEPSVVAATSSIGKFFAPHSFTASSTPSIMIGQVHLLHVETAEANQILQRKDSIIHQLNKHCQSMMKRGGGVKDIRLREISECSNANYKNYSMDVVINVCDAMGANITNTIAEKAKEIITFMGIKTGISILTNYCIERKSVSKFMIPVEQMSWKGHKGIDVAQKVLQAYHFAKSDVFRAVTHNKGIMNGIDAVCLATGQDWRAVESAAHAYASRKGSYQPLTHYQIIELDGKKYLMGMLQLPVAVGTIGGTIAKNALYKESLKIMGNPSTQELAEVMVTVGLAQNFAALRAMAIEGIQKGHMKLHVRAMMNMAKVPEYLEEECFRFMSSKKKFNEQAINEFMEHRLRPRL